MKIVKHENGIELVPETEFDKECLQHLYAKGVKKMEWTDNWERNGNLKLEGRSSSYDNEYGS